MYNIHFFKDPELDSALEVGLNINCDHDLIHITNRYKHAQYIIV